jgi:hypothetical protein
MTIHYIIIMEEFRKIEGYKNYSISNLGNVRNDKTNRILKAGNNKGYKLCVLNRKTLSVHRLVAIAFIPNPDNKQQIDHIDNNRSNNNVNNLRWSTSQENQCNKGISNKNTSGYKGVYYVKDRKKWRAEISINGKSTFIGIYETSEDAVIARYKEALKIHKDFISKDEIEQYNQALYFNDFIYNYK